jgi:NAD(P)-dependent dehydrogenase (short-subunit alcohol dehydrogenase family)
MFAREGAQIGVADIDPQSAETVAGEIHAQGGSARPLVFDVANSAAVAKGYKDFLAAFGQIDVSVHYAGLRQIWPVIAYDETLPKNAQLPDEFWNGMIASHLSGSFYCAREALKSMVPRKRGRIINCGSAVAHNGFGSSAAYVAAKLGIVGLTRALAAEAAPYGVLVNCIAPGPIDTPRPGIGRLPKDIHDAAVTRTPARRWAHPREAASVALFLASEDASFMVGQVLSPNGGSAMGI